MIELDRARRAQVEREIAQLAADQYGHATRTQLINAGLPKSTVDHRVRVGLLYVRHRGVYAVGHPGEILLGAEMAAVLACGDGAVLSHHSAAALWGFRAPRLDGAVDVTVAGSHRAQRRGIRLHGGRRGLSSRERTNLKRIPITTPARTLLDLAATLTHRDLERALDEAITRRLTSLTAIHDLLAHHLRRRGTAGLAALADRNRNTPVTHSQAEERFLDLNRRAHLPEPRVNAQLERYEADFVWPEAKLIVELDGHAYHSSRRALERDHLRDAELRRQGWTILRFTARQLTTEPEVVVAQIAAELTRGGHPQMGGDPV